MPRWNYSALKGAGGVVSTTNDLFQWIICLEKCLQEEPEWGSRYFSGGGPGNYAYGWQLSEDGAIQFHAGETPGYCALIIRHPNLRTTAILLFNSDFLLLKRQGRIAISVDNVRVLVYNPFKAWLLV